MEYLLHDFHCHSYLSPCSNDPTMTTEAMMKNAKERHLKAICITDHMWDMAYRTVDHFFYGHLDIPFIMKNRDLPKDDTIPFFFGCETELPAEGIPALTREHFDLFDFVVIPPNHMHFIGLVRKEEIDTPKKMALEMENRLENLLMQDLPFEKIGIAHLTCSLMFSEGSVADVVHEMNEARLLRIFAGYAKAGAGIEINTTCIHECQKEFETRHDEMMLLYRIAKEAGCKFYLGTDAHFIREFSSLQENAPMMIRELGLTDDDRYEMPALKQYASQPK